MTQRLPPHTLMVTFLHDRLKKRGITLRELITLLDPIPERRIENWFKGHDTPRPTELEPLAAALEVSPVELTCGWLIDLSPRLEGIIRQHALDRMPSRFPRSVGDDLRAPAPWPRMDVGDPFDAREPGSHLQADAPVMERTAVNDAGKPAEP
jgi:transcriptional regulator with XRE-family HTH domain